MTVLRINPDVFNSAKTYKQMQDQSLQASKALFDYIEKLSSAANNTRELPVVDFSLLPFKASKAMDGGLSDFALLFQKYEIVEKSPAIASAEITAHDETSKAPEQLQSPDIIANMPELKLVEASVMDFSFDVHKDQHHLLIPALKVRFDTEVSANPDQGTLIVKRNPSSGSLMPTDQMSDFANYLFTWVFENLPEEDRPAFLKNCEAEGLTQSRETIGFKRNNDRPELLAA